MSSRSELKARAKSKLENNIFGSKWLMALLACIIFSVINSAAGSIIPGIGFLLVTGPITYGLDFMFLKQSRDGNEMNLSDLFKGFTDDFSGTFLIGLLSSIFIFLWSLLLIIPGIVKAISYSQAYYVKAEHPEYDWKQCLDTSSRLMRGHKMEFFVLGLSFIGWLIVGALCFGIGTLWVVPYINATKAEFYNDLVANQ